MNINRSKVEKRIGFRGIYLIADCNMKLILNSLPSFEVFFSNTSKTVMGKTVTLYFIPSDRIIFRRGLYKRNAVLINLCRFFLLVIEMK